MNTNKALMTLIVLASLMVAACSQHYKEGEEVRVKPNTPFTYAGVQYGGVRPLNWLMVTTGFNYATIVTVDPVHYNATVEFHDSLINGLGRIFMIPMTSIVGYTGPACTWPTWAGQNNPVVQKTPTIRIDPALVNPTDGDRTAALERLRANAQDYRNPVNNTYSPNQ